MPSIYINNVGEITFDKEVLDAANIKPGDSVLIKEIKEGLMITKVKEN
ncbi:MAG: AbrB/MazE/SpoVT family DNA-binding domain-containing protein [Bacillota bacterium]